MEDGADARPEPGTLNDLIADAKAAGVSFEERDVRAWRTYGLLGAPQRRPLGRNRGSEPALYSPEQRALFQAEVRQRAAKHPYKWVACIPVWAWLNYGEDWVDLEQVRRALVTAVGDARQSERVAGQTAQLVLAMVDHKQGRPGARGKLRDEIVDQLRTGRIDAEALLPLIRAVFEPADLQLVRGPMGASMTAQDMAYSLRVRLLAAKNVKRLTDEQLITAGQQHRASWPDYQQRRRELQAQAGSLASLFGETTPEQDVTSSVSTLLLLLGMQLDGLHGRKDG